MAEEREIYVHEPALFFFFFFFFFSISVFSLMEIALPLCACQTNFMTKKRSPA